MILVEIADCPPAQIETERPSALVHRLLRPSPSLAVRMPDCPDDDRMHARAQLVVRLRRGATT